ncbi:hypothetical protein CBS101457_006845 [Exobasidium rhododendri]|nr:hypothetical protein CBS101457_006845 [Exobasidium rhododendri]
MTKLQIAIDRGGTFTDALGRLPGEDTEDIVIKLLSHDPNNYKDAPREAVRRILEIHRKSKIRREEKMETSDVEYIRLSTTVATNALLERKGEKHALVTTKGFKDVVQIGNQSRPRIFDLAIRKPDVLYSTVVEIDERVTLVGYTSDPKADENRIVFSNDGVLQQEYKGEDRPPLDHSGKEATIKQGVSGEAVAILKEPDREKVKADLKKIYDDGIKALAIVLMHSYTYPEHERIVEEIAKEIGFTHISVSSTLMPMIKMVPRGTSSTADAYLTPVLKAYIDSFFSGFDSSLRDGTSGTRVEFMMSDGGLTSVDRFSGLKSIISGPAGGVVAMARTAYDSEDGRPVVSIDMGGTSSDVARFAGRYEQVFETTLAGVTIQSPQLDVNTVASGGSSRLFFRNGLFNVGPESASAHPGPVCYRKGGPLAITDANLITGHLAVEMFPKIFGPNENEGLDEEASKKEMEKLQIQINKETGKQMSLDEVAQGFIRVANETMCRPIRALTEARGYSASKHILCCFGGAGGQHACSLARSLGIKTVMIHKYSSILSAYGMALADRVFEQQEPSSEIWDSSAKGKVLQKIQSKVQTLENRVRKELESHGFRGDQLQVEILLNLRYDGTDTALMTLKPKDDWAFEKAFVETYKQEFGFVLSDKDIIVDDIRVKGIGRSFDIKQESVHSEHAKLAKDKFKAATSVLEKASKKSVYFEKTGRIDVPIVKLKELEAGAGIRGPAVLVDETQTILIEPDCEAHICQNTVVIKILYEADESLIV